MSGGALSIVQSASQLLASLLIEEAKFLYSVKEKMEKLHLHLRFIQCCLEDVDRKDNKSQVINQWILEIRELAYEAKNIVDKYVVRVSHHQQRKGGVWNTVKWFSDVLFDFKALHEVGSDVDNLSRRISELTSIMQLCGSIVDVTHNSDMMTNQLAELRRTSPFQIEEDDVLSGLTRMWQIWFTT